MNFNRYGEKLKAANLGKTIEEQKIFKLFEFFKFKFTFKFIPLIFAYWWISIRAPTGEVLKISEDATFQNGRIKSSNVGICFICFFSQTKNDLS